MAVFLAAILPFCLNYILVLAGIRENQIPSSPPGAATVDWRADGLRVWGWHWKTTIEEFIKQNAWNRIPFSELNMGFRKWIGMRFFPDAENTLRLNNGYLVFPLERYDCANCAGQIIALRDFCNRQGLAFLDVVALHKTDPQGRELPAGMEDHCYDNADQFIHRLAARAVPTLDLRNSPLPDFCSNYYDLFFRTDHHWRPETGMWAAAEIVKAVNQQCRLAAPAGLFALSNYTVRIYPRYFLGSLGRKVTLAYTHPDDFSLVVPNFNTDLELSIPGKHFLRRGTFQEALIDPSYLTGKPPYYTQSTYDTYLQGDNAQLRITNYLKPDGLKILVIKDSFANVVMPFLALAAREVDALDLRHFTGSVYSFIEQTRPDVVIVLYAAESLRPRTSGVWERHPLPISVSNVPAGRNPSNP